MIGERTPIYVEITKQTAHAHICSLRGKFTELICTLAPIFVFYMNIFPYGSRLFTIDPFISFLPASHRHYFILGLSLHVTLALRYICFKYLDRVKSATYKNGRRI